MKILLLVHTEKYIVCLLIKNSLKWCFINEIIASTCLPPHSNFHRKIRTTPCEPSSTWSISWSNLTGWIVQQQFPSMSQQTWCLLMLSFLWSMITARQKQDRQCTYSVILACSYNHCSLGNMQCIILSTNEIQKI